MIGKPLVRHHTPGELALPGERTGYVTRSGLIIGLRAPPRPQPVGRHAEIVQAVLLHPRPLRWDQMFVRAILKVTHDQTA